MRNLPLSDKSPEDSLPRLTDQQESQAREVDEIRRKLAETGEKIRGLKVEASQHKQRRDDANSEVRDLKATKEALRNELVDRREQVAKSRENFLKSGSTSFSQRERLEKDLKRLEWTLQTHVLDRAEETALVKKVKDIEQQLAPIRRKESSGRKIIEAKAEIARLKEKIEAVNERIIALAKESQKEHEALIKISDRIREIQASRDELTMTYNESRRRLQETRKEYRETMTGIRKRERQEGQAKARQYLERLQESASKKMRRGEKMTFQELQALLGTDEESE